MKKKISILGTPLNPYRKKDLLLDLSKDLEKSKTVHLITVNAEMIVEAQSHREFRRLLQSVDYAIADGSGILWAAKFQSIKTRGVWRLLWLMLTGASLVLHPDYVKSEIPEKIPGRVLWLDICQLAEKKKKEVFLLGRSDGLSGLQEVKDKLQRKFPKLKISGDFSWHKKVGAKYYQELRKKIPKNAVIFSALGHPQQDLIFSEIKLPPPRQGEASSSFQMGVGGSFDFFLNKQNTAPQIFVKTGTEWLYRLARQPRRIKRIWNAVVRLPYLMWGGVGFSV